MTKKPAAEVRRLVRIGFRHESQRRAKRFVTHFAHPEKTGPQAARPNRAHAIGTCTGTDRMRP